jgi:hypothetical protein
VDVVVDRTTECVPPPAGLVGWWRGEGDATDSAGANEGTIQGAVSFGPGMVGQAFSFNGSGTVSVPDSPALDPRQYMTVAAWFNVIDVPVNFPGIVTKGPTNAQYLIFLNALASTPSGAAPVCFRVNVGPDNPASSAQVVLRTVCSSTPVLFNQFTHVAGTYDGTTLKL